MDAAKHPTMYKATPHNKELSCPQMPIELRLRKPALRGGVWNNPVARIISNIAVNCYGQSRVLIGKETQP